MHHAPSYACTHFLVIIFSKIFKIATVATIVGVIIEVFGLVSIIKSLVIWAVSRSFGHMDNILAIPKILHAPHINTPKSLVIARSQKSNKQSKKCVGRSVGNRSMLIMFVLL